MNNDLTAYLADLVEKKVEELLAPHLDALVRLQTFLGTGRRGPGRPPGRASALGRARRPGARRARRAPKGDASKFHEGQKVKYRQGRGEFNAKVTKVDVKANTVTVERENDGKKVTRPAGKLYGA